MEIFIFTAVAMLFVLLCSIALSLYFRISSGIGLLFVSLALMFSGVAQAKQFTEADVPNKLKSWIPWVMHDVQKNTCPFYYTSQEQRICEWSTSVGLELNNTGGNFSYVVEIVDTRDDKPQRVILPGRADMWPQDVKVNGKSEAVLIYNELPSLLLTKGTYAIGGTYIWDKLPVVFTLPQQVGIVNVKINGKDVAIPQIDGDQLSLQRDTVNDDVVAENYLEVKLFRKITDSIPQMIETRVKLNVSGKQREEVFGEVLNETMEPLSITSELPARLDNGKKLRVQVRPGQYEIAIISRLKSQSNQFALPEKNAKENNLLPSEEIWSFEAQNQLRLVQVSGVLAIDPNQTELPPEWRSFPSYLIKHGETLNIQEIKRGIADSTPDQLSLQRKLWLDFSGEGYTAQDMISGTIKSSSRLEVLDGTKLGSASINGQDQYINTIQKDGKAGAAGVEVREGAISLTANSRMDLATAANHPSGWNAKFDSLSATLYLPPGWKLFGYSGVDSVSSSWIGNWTLVDVFLVMITAVATYRLLGIRLGIVTSVALVLIHPELPAFTSLFLTVIICIVIEKSLKEGRLKTYIGGIGKIIFIMLVVTVLPFMFRHIRETLYPQLATHAQTMAETRFEGQNFGADMGRGANLAATAPSRMKSMDGNVPVAAPMMALPQEQTDSFARSVEEPMPSGNGGDKKSYYNKEKSKGAGKMSGSLQQQYQNYAPDTKVQTGYSQRNITESGITLRWNGSVDPMVSMKLWLLSARVNFLLALVRIGLMALLIANMVGSVMPKIREKMRLLFPLVLIAFFATLMPESDSFAKELVTGKNVAASSSSSASENNSENFPPAYLLDELKRKLSANINQPAGCLPECASLARTRISINSDRLMLDLEIHTDDEVAVPLPGGISNFRPVSVMVNGVPAKAATVGANGYLMVKLPRGISKIHLAGAISTVSNSLGISFPLASRHTVVATEGWSVQGVREDGITESSVQFTRTESHVASNSAAEDDFKKTVIPAFYRVERTITLANRWEVATTVHKLNALEAPSATQIPLLKGESVTSSNTQVKDGKALISFDAGERDVTFQSVLAAESPIMLSAPKDANWVEVWKLNSSNLWHVTTSGIPRIYEANTATAEAANVMPAGASGYSLWMPWSGEVLTINIERPSGVEGATRTIDQSNLTVTPSDRSTDVVLDFSIRSSLGGQHNVTLPENAVLSDVTKNGLLLPSQLKENVLSLPLTPGTNNFVLRWKETTPISVSYRPSTINIGADRSVNANISMSLPQDRWILFTVGPLMGAAVLFWSWIPIILLLSFGLGKIQSSPLRMHHWCIFLLGISLSSVDGVIIMIAWVLAFAWRANLNHEVMKPLLFNFLQLVLALLTLLAMQSLFDSIHHGLLGFPQMHISGNGSYGNSLRWYQDITGETLPQPLVISAPIWVYRALMLLWALWLAFSLVNWLRWGWASFTSGGYWSKTWRAKKSVEVSSEVENSAE